MLKRKQISCDLCVVGGGISGMCAAIAAAREGISVVLMQERPVLGGNASSEIRMWICGASGPNNRETGILEEIALENLYRNPTKNYSVWDGVLYDFVRREKNIKLLLNCTCMDAKTETDRYADGRDTRITRITGYQMTTQSFVDVDAKFYCDASGDSILAPLTGAEFRMGREAASEFGEQTVNETADDMTMGMSCMVRGRETTAPVTYIPPEFTIKLCEKDFEHRDPVLESDSENFWYLELGGDRHSIDDTEEVRDELLGLAAGTWDYVKNSGKFKAENWELDFMEFLPGKRESRRMVGEYIIRQTDISGNRVFEDEIAFGGWWLDDHYPGGFYHRGVPNSGLTTPSPYSIPYRALYSKNVENLYFAGRNISMTHTAMSSIRVMATCGLLGEAVGKAASIAVKDNLTPHGVYRERLTTLQTLLQKEDSFLPHFKREISQICKDAKLFGGDETLRNGFDRRHTLYGNEEEPYIGVEPGEEIRYEFAPTKVQSVHIVFDSDLNRETLPGSECERIHTMRANQKLDAPVMHMPTTLCKQFRLVGGLNGEEFVLYEETLNRKRSHEIKIEQQLDYLALRPLSDWGESELIPVISFDFE